MRLADESSATNGMIFDVQPFSLHDGPGIRTTVFFKGCNLRCYWCHNPESWNQSAELQFFPAKCIGCGACAKVCPKAKGGITAKFSTGCTLCGRCAEECYSGAIRLVGEEISVDELVERLLRDRDVFEQSGGGVTLSGGEPLLQPKFLQAVLQKLKAANIHTAVETAACIPWYSLAMLYPLVDLMFCDIKCIDEEKHHMATGMSNRQILENIRCMSEKGVNLCLRTPIIPTFNDTIADMEGIADFVLSLPKRHMVELLPFHGLCVGKYTSLNREFEAEGYSTPSQAKMQELESVFLGKGCILKPSGKPNFLE